MSTTTTTTAHNMTEVQRQALTNAISSSSAANYDAIFQGFTEKGIPESEIKPRENVFTFHAWKALGRQVRKGEHGVKVMTWITCKEKGAKDARQGADQDAGNAPGTYRRPKTTTVFHVSQTDAIN